MTKQMLSSMMEWQRPVGIGLVIFVAYALSDDAIAQFHILGPLIVVVMSGSVAFESLVLGEVSSEKIGYAPQRAYQIQSGLANAAIAITALLVFVLGWGRFAEAAIVLVMLIFFALSGANHALTAWINHNFKPVNLLRPVLSLLLIGFLLPHLIKALA